MKKIKILFIHHSTGGLLLNQGNVRELAKWMKEVLTYPNKRANSEIGPKFVEMLIKKPS